MAQSEALKVRRKEAKQQTARRGEIRIELQKDISWLETAFKNASEGKKPITRNHGRKRNRDAPDSQPESYLFFQDNIYEMIDDYCHLDYSNTVLSFKF